MEADRGAGASSRALDSAEGRTGAGAGPSTGVRGSASTDAGFASAITHCTDASTEASPGACMSCAAEGLCLLAVARPLLAEVGLRGANGRAA
jgi:hypothetical protein